MVLSWDLETDSSIDLEEFIAFLDNLGDRVLIDQMDESALMLRKLYNNRDFLSRTLLKQLENRLVFDSINPYTPQVFMLHRSENYFLRAAVWVPPAGRPGEEIFFYEDPHDHYFALLTLGYEGPGYETVIFEYDHEKVSGDVGEKVDVRFLTRVKLPRGRVLFYRDSRDIHVQLPSEDFSISINVVVPKLQMNRQYSFRMELHPSTKTALIKENLMFHKPTLVARFAHDVGVPEVANRLRSFVDDGDDCNARRIAGELIREIERVEV